MRSRVTRAFAVAATAILFASAGCGAGGAPAAGATKANGSTPPTHEPEILVAVIDLSSSITAADRSRSQHLLTSIVDSLSFGDELVAFVAHEAGRKGETPTKVYAMPAAKSPARPTSAENTAMLAARNFARASLQELLAHPAVPGTDLLASLHTAADYVQGSAKRHRSVVLLSDMLQCTRTACMEPPRPPFPGSMVAQQKADSTLPDLQGVCISAVGPDPSTKHGIGVRDFWKAYFEAAGADFSVDRYRQIITHSGLLRC